MVRIKDVAKAAGVAPSTVSLVLNKKGYVSVATREKVEAAMAELNYIPSEVARNLSLSRTNTIGVVMPSAAHPFFGEVIEALEAALYEQHYKMVLCCTHDNGETERNFVDMLKRRTMDGIIMGAHSLDVSLYDNIKQPIVAFDRFINNDIPIIHCDHEYGGRLAAEAFLQHKCHHLVEIIGHHAVKSPANAYHRVCAELLQAHGIKVDTIERPWNEVSYRSFLTVANRLFTVYPDVDAILGSDLSVSACLQVAKSKGLRAPQDIRMVAYDGTLVTQMGLEPITAIRQPVRDLAKLAVQKVIERIEGKEIDGPWMIKPQLLRGTTC